MGTAAGGRDVRAESWACRQKTTNPINPQPKTHPGCGTSRRRSSLSRSTALRANAHHVGVSCLRSRTSAAPWPRPTLSLCWRNARSRAVSTVQEPNDAPGSTGHAKPSASLQACHAPCSPARRGLRCRCGRFKVFCKSSLEARRRRGL